MRNFWIAHVRGPNFEQLKKKGFLVLYPEIDDYVFLEVNPDNLQHLRKQLQLGVSFLRSKKELVKVTEADIDKMKKVTTDRIEVGAAIEVIAGFAEALEGKILEVNEATVLCELQGYKRTYTVEVNKLDVAVKR